MDGVELYRSADRKKCKEYALVLQSMGIPASQVDVPGASVLVVAPEFAPRAAAELESYVRENVDWPPRDEFVFDRTAGAYEALAYVVLLSFVHWLDVGGRFGIDWLASGRVAKAEIEGGEWWRALTGLTLHADLSHLGGNLFFGAFFGVLLCHVMRSGLAWMTMLAGGTLGNLLAALLAGDGYRAIGASTLVMSALGSLAAYQWAVRRRTRMSFRRQWGPLFFGVVLLGLLGFDTGRENVGYGAHASGFLCGALLGLVHGRWALPERLSAAWQRGLLVATPLCLAAAWSLALFR